MNIRLVKWKELEAKTKAANQALTDLWHLGLEEYNNALKANDSEAAAFWYEKIAKIAGDARESLPHHSLFHPQSEWMGGDSDDPKNHKLREPNVCPAPRRYFTPEEIAEAKAVCHGPVQWSFGENK